MICGELVRLGTKRNLYDPHGQLGDKASGDGGAGPASRIITIQHQGDLAEVLLKKRFLPS